MRYKAFLSYSHAADGKLAPALQSALQRFARPWYQLRAMRVFRDKTSLAATPSAKDLNDLRVPPGNRLEKLGADRRGQHSIRINVQWRICFRWRDDGPWDVEIVDYH